MPPPVITDVEPDHGPDDQDVTLTIAGGYFQAVPAVTLVSPTLLRSASWLTTNDTPLEDVAFMNSSQLTATVPAGLNAGTYGVQVCNPDGRCDTLPDAYTATGSGPTLTGIIPGQGFGDVPNDVTLHGYNLRAGIAVTVGVTPLQQTVWMDTTRARAVVPAGLAPGPYDVTARNPDSEQTSTLSQAYTVLDRTVDDFSVTSEDVWSSPATIRQGDVVALGANVHRLGGREARAVDVAFYRGNPAAGGTWLGTATTPPMTPGINDVQPVSVLYTAGQAGAVEVYVVVDPANAIAETSEANNQARRTFTILPPVVQDRTPPVINSLLVNGGAEVTTDRNVVITLAATDPPDPGSGVSSSVRTMRLVEREFNASAQQWVAVQETGWVPFQSPYSFTLTERGGVRYIQAWVADGAGNISTMAEARIDYVSASGSLLAGQVHVYRRTLEAGQSLSVTLESLSGDADLYVWSPDGSQSWVSDNEGSATDEVGFTAELTGDYQIEVYGYTDATYRLTITVSAGVVAGAERAAVAGNASKPRRNEPATPPTNPPPDNSAVPAALIAPTLRLYLPLLCISCGFVPPPTPVTPPQRLYLPLLLASGPASPGHRLIAPAQRLH